MRTLFCILFLALTVAAAGQSSERQIGVYVQPSYVNRIWSVGTAPSPGYVDSLNKLDRYKVGFSAGLVFQFNLNKQWKMEVGAGVTQTGFDRKYKNVKYLDQLHPELPRITDNLQGDPKHIDFYYRYVYMDVPIWFHYKLRPLHRKIQLNYYFTTGIITNILLDDKVLAYTRGFSMEGKNPWKLNNVQYDSRAFNFTLNVGARVEYKVSPKLRVNATPLLNIPVLTASKGNDHIRLLGAGVNFSACWLINKLASE